MRTGINDGKQIVAAEWVEDEVQAYLKEKHGGKQEEITSHKKH